MKTVQILEEEDTVFPSDYCRPLQIVSMNGGHSDYYSFESCYSGRPENNVRWCRVDQIFGDTWLYKKVHEFAVMELKYEFIRGEIPPSHFYGKTRPELRQDYFEYLYSTPMGVGKYKGYPYAWVKQKDHSYFEWAISQGLILDFDEYVRKNE